MRHEKVLTSKEQIYKLVDVSLRQTLTRSINTVLTVIITVVVMLLVGSSSIYTFNVALLIGLIFGLYSSLFIAAQLWACLLYTSFTELRSFIRTYGDFRRRFTD